MVVPAGWKEVRLGEYASMRSGGTPLTSVASFYGGTIPWASISDMSASGKYLGSTDRYITEAGLASSPAVVFPVGVLLYAMYASIGECCISVCPMATSQAILGIKCADDLSLEFLYYTMQSKRAEIARSGQQGTQANLNAQMVRETMFPLPPLKEQEAIAEALSVADAVIESINALIAKKRDVKQATMQQLLTGRTRLPGFTADWKEVRLGDIALVVMGQSPQSIYYNTREDGIPLIQGNADINDRKSIRRIWTSVSPKVAEPGAVLITVRAPVGYAAIASEQVCLGRGVCAIQPHAADSRFVFHSLVYWEPKWKKLEQGSTFTAANSKEVNDFTIHVPDSTKEQEAIAEALTVMDDELEALTQQVSKLRMVKEGMMQDLLTGKVRLV